MTVDDAVAWMARGLALAAAVAALELLRVRRALADTGVFAWPVLRRELAGAPRGVRAVADAVLSYRGTLAVLALQLAAALALPWIDHPAPAWIVFATSLAIAIRFRGAYNGGSDAMLLVVALAVALARSAPDSRLALAALGYAAAQLVLSYFIAGVAKLADPAWRRGTALRIVVRLPQYQVAAAAQALLSRPVITRVAAWAMLAFECGFPLALTDRTVCLALLAFGAGFHLTNAIVFGLNRFLWAWLAAYPALVFWVARLHG
ncbi:MAG: HTTM domain-containing protein [Deltaproteobacteria bacterium]|nr:HTTM domain-containing protein [Deltaproteobacteria bacterium]